MSAIPYRFVLFLALLPLFPGTLYLNPFPDIEAQPSNAIKVQVDLVSVNVVVSDSRGRYITGLRKEQFRLEEDKVEQSITHFSPVDAPFRLVLALDTSSSMREKLHRIQDEAIRFVEMLHPDDEVAVISFDDQVRWESSFSPDRKRIIRGIKSTRTGESTQVYEAVYLCLEKVLGKSESRKTLVLFSDGVDTASHTTSSRETIRLAEESDTLIYPIRFNTLYDLYHRGSSPGVKVGPGLSVPLPIPLPGGTGNTPYPSGRDEQAYQGAARYLRELADKTGGMVFNADTIEDLGSAFSKVAEELRNQYSIGYISSNTCRDGKFRKIKISTTQPEYVARARRGYYAPKS